MPGNHIAHMDLNCYATIVDKYLQKSSAWGFMRKLNIGRYQDYKSKRKENNESWLI